MLSKTDGGQVRYWDSRRRRCPYCFLPFKKVIVFIIQELRLLSRIPREKPRQSHELRICLWGTIPTSSRPGAVYSMARLNGKMLYYYPVAPYHSTYRSDPTKLREDVSIVPYDHDGPQSIQHTLANLCTCRFFHIHKRFTHAIGVGKSSRAISGMGAFGVRTKCLWIAGTMPASSRGRRSGSLPGRVSYGGMSRRCTGSRQ